MKKEKRVVKKELKELGIQGTIPRIVDADTNFNWGEFYHLARNDEEGSLKEANAIVEKYIGKKNFLTEFLGAGMAGPAFRTRVGGVYKFTSEGAEAGVALAMGLLYKNLKTQARIFKVYELELDGDKFWIVDKELVEPITDYLEDEKADNVLGEIIDLLGSDYKSYEEFKNKLTGVPGEDGKTFKMLFTRKPKFMQTVFEFYSNLKKDEKTLKTRLADTHAGNIGMRGDRVLCFDCVYRGANYSLAKGGFTGMKDLHIDMSVVVDKMSDKEVADYLKKSLKEFNENKYINRELAVDKMTNDKYEDYLVEQDMRMDERKGLAKGGDVIALTNKKDTLKEEYNKAIIDGNPKRIKELEKKFPSINAKLNYALKKDWAEKHPMARGGKTEAYKIAYLNKNKNYQRDEKVFEGKDAYEKAVKWAERNLDNYDEDMIRLVRAKGGDVQPHDEDNERGGSMATGGEVSGQGEKLWNGWSYEQKMEFLQRELPYSELSPKEFIRKFGHTRYDLADYFARLSWNDPALAGVRQTVIEYTSRSSFDEIRKKFPFLGMAKGGEVSDKVYFNEKMCKYFDLPYKNDKEEFIVHTEALTKAYTEVYGQVPNEYKHIFEKRGTLKLSGIGLGWWQVSEGMAKGGVIPKALSEQIKSIDWSYAFSDDNRWYQSGEAHRKEIKKMLIDVLKENPELYEAIRKEMWKEYLKKFKKDAGDIWGIDSTMEKALLVAKNVTPDNKIKIYYVKGDSRVTYVFLSEEEAEMGKEHHNENFAEKWGEGHIFSKEVPLKDWTDGRITANNWIMWESEKYEKGGAFDHEKFQNDELEASGFDVLKLTEEQKGIILQPSHAPENYMMDGEISRKQAFSIWKNRLAASGLSPADIKRAVNMHFKAHGGEMTSLVKSKEHRNQ